MSVVVVISEPASPQFFGELIVFLHLNMDVTIILEYTFSLSQKYSHVNIDAYVYTALSAGYNYTFKR